MTEETPSKRRSSASRVLLTNNYSYLANSVSTFCDAGMGPLLLDPDHENFYSINPI